MGLGYSFSRPERNAKRSSTGPAVVSPSSRPLLSNSGRRVSLALPEAPFREFLDEPADSWHYGDSALN
jgi:hypothetical protein